MKKRVLAVLVFMGILLSGCTKLEIDIKIKQGGKTDVSFLYATKEANGSYSQGGLSQEDYSDLIDWGYEIEDYSSGDYSGYIATKQNVDLLSCFFVDSEESYIEHNGLTEVMNIQFLSDSERDTLDQMRASSSTYKNAGASFIVRMTFPTKPSNHNATFVTNGGKTLEWDLLETSGPAYVEYSLISTETWMVLCACIIAIVLFLYSYKKKQDKKQIES